RRPLRSCQASAKVLSATKSIRYSRSAPSFHLLSLYVKTVRDLGAIFSCCMSWYSQRHACGCFGFPPFLYVSSNDTPVSVIVSVPILPAFLTCGGRECPCQTSYPKSCAKLTGASSTKPIKSAPVLFSIRNSTSTPRRLPDKPPTPE